MKKTHLILAIAITFFNLGFSQGGGEIANSQFAGNGFVRTTPTSINANVEGSPYMTDDFQLAKISVSETEIFNVKYNALLDEIEVKNNNGEVYALNKYGRKDITITLLKTNTTYQIFSYIDESSTLVNGFFSHLTSVDSNTKILKQEHKKFINEKVGTTSYDKTRPAHYRQLNDKYFIKIDDQNAIEVPTKNKEFVKLFPNKQKEVLNYIKTEKIKLKKEDDLVKLAQYLNLLK